MYLLLERLPHGRWAWGIHGPDHRRLAAAPEPLARREECLAAAAEHLGGEIDLPVVERGRGPRPASTWDGGGVRLPHAVTRGRTRL